MSKFVIHHSISLLNFSPLTNHYSSSFLITFLATSILNFLPFIFSSLMACNKSLYFIEFTAQQRNKIFHFD
jgi:hypothetical protein